MPGYIEDALTRFKHARPRTPQDQPHPQVPPNYSATRQYADQQDDPPLLEKAGKKVVQEVCGTLLYYARAVDCMMLAALGSITTEHTSPTANTMRNIKQLPDYAATHPDSVVTYRSSNIVLAAHSDASYLSETKSRSRAGGHFFMASNISVPENNGAVHTAAQIIKTVMSSVAEEELGALYINSCEAISAPHLLEAMGHHQPPNCNANQQLHRVGRLH